MAPTYSNGQEMVSVFFAIKLCFAIFGKNSKIQNGRHFWGGENFLKIAESTFLRYPVGRKFRRNRTVQEI